MGAKEGHRVEDQLRSIFLTNSVDMRTVREIMKAVRAGSGQNRIIVVKARVRGQSKRLILDGNHRAVALAKLGLPLRCLEARRS